MGGRLAIDAVEILAGMLAVAVTCLAGIAVRRWVLERGGGTVACEMRVTGAGQDRRWRLGLARYQGDKLCWFRIFDASMRPRATMSRRGLVVVRQRRPTAEETAELGSELMIVECRGHGHAYELAMSESAVTGFLAWLEATPPGAYLGSLL